jgi:hypothetical protein
MPIISRRFLLPADADDIIALAREMEACNNAVLAAGADAT